MTEELLNQLQELTQSANLTPDVMNLTKRQITIVVASLLAYQNKYRLDTEMYKDIDELVELFDLEHQKTLMEEKKLLKECRQTGRTTATTEKVLKTVFSQMTEEETLALIKKWSPLLDKEQSPNVKAMLIESQETKVKETDTSKVLIEGDTATINGIKYKRVEEPKPEREFLCNVMRNLGYSIDCCDEIVDAVKEWLPDELIYDGEEYQLGWNAAITTIKDRLG